MESLARLRERIPPIPAWGRIAIVLALALVAYFGFLGTRYLAAESQISSANAQIAVAESSIGRQLPDIDGLRADLEDRTELLDAWKEVYSFDGYAEWQGFFDLEGQQGKDLLVAIVSATAQQAGVQVQALRSMSPATETFEGLIYDVHSLRLSAAAKNHFDFFRFVELLHRSVPIVRASKVTVAGFGSDPTADLEVKFFTLVDADEETDDQ